MMFSPWCLLALATLAAPVESIAVEVDASSIDPEGPGITRQLGGKVSAALTEQGISVDDAAANHLRIEVRQTSVMSYDVAFMVEVGGKAVEPGLEHVTCNRCPLVRMDEAVLDKLPDALALMEQASEPERAVEAPTAEEPKVSELPEDAAEPLQEEPSQPSKKGRALGPVGIAGIAMGTVGLGGVIAGASLLAKGANRTQDPLTPEIGELEDFRPAGRVWLGAGVAAAMVGGMLLIVDLRVLQRRRSTVAVSPVLSPMYGGLAVEGRF